MDNKKFVSHLKKIGACEDAVEWVEQHGGTSAECWRDCVRGDWMAWLVAKDAKKLGVTKQQLVGALADCAALSLKHYEAKYPKDRRVRECINTCRRYAKGKATDEELKNAAASAYDAAASASAAAAAASAYDAYAASASASAAAASAYASAAAASAYAYAAAAREKTLKRCAGIFRKHFPAILD